MRWWEEYTKREGAEMNANPSPGNKAGGLTTILENHWARWPRPAAPIWSTC
jgi:altronate dehydratase